MFVLNWTILLFLWKFQSSQLFKKCEKNVGKKICQAQDRTCVVAARSWSANHYSTIRHTILIFLTVAWYVSPISWRSSHKSKYLPKRHNCFISLASFDVIVNVRPRFVFFYYLFLFHNLPYWWTIFVYQRLEYPIINFIQFLLYWNWFLLWHSMIILFHDILLQIPSFATFTLVFYSIIFFVICFNSDYVRRNYDFYYRLSLFFGLFLLGFNFDLQLFRKILYFQFTLFK